MYDFLRCFVDWVTLEFLSTKKTEEFARVIIGDEHCVKESTEKSKTKW